MSFVLLAGHLGPNKTYVLRATTEILLSATACRRSGRRLELRLLPSRSGRLRKNLSGLKLFPVLRLQQSLAIDVPGPFS